jgi:hypothetical protein
MYTCINYMRGNNENFRLSTHVQLLTLTLDSKLGLTNYLKITDQSNRTYEFILVIPGLLFQ